MNEAIKAQWLAALRSGAYRQGRHGLHVEDTYCCLGVLCDLHAQATGGAWERESYLGQSEVLPNEVAWWAGIEDDTAPDNPYAGAWHLAEWNDGSLDGECPPTGFCGIADLIEEYL